MCRLHVHIHTHTHFTSSAEAANATNRIIFLTDLQSTCDSVNDEKRLLSTIRSNADAGVYTTVVGIGMVCTCVCACLLGEGTHCVMLVWLVENVVFGNKRWHCLCMSVPVPMLLKPLSQFVSDTLDT